MAGGEKIVKLAARLKDPIQEWGGVRLDDLSHAEAIACTKVMGAALRTLHESNMRTLDLAAAMIAVRNNRL